MIYVISIVLLILFNAIILSYPREVHKNVVMPNSWETITYKEYKSLLKRPVEIFLLSENVYYGYIIHSWDMKYYTKSGILSIGCRDNTIDEWKHFFSDDCTIQYQTNRNTLAFKYIKTKFYQFLKELEKQKIIQ